MERGRESTMATRPKIELHLEGMSKMADTPIFGKTNNHFAEASVAEFQVR